MYFKSLIRRLVLFFVFSMPFVSAFSFTATLSMPLLVACLILILSLLPTTIGTPLFPDRFLGYDLVYILLFLSTCLVSFFTNGLGNMKSLNHTIAYFTTFTVFYFAIKLALFRIDEKERIDLQILRSISIVVFINALYVNIEFLLVNFSEFNLNEFIPRPSEEEKEYDPLVVELFIRARGFAPESGHYAFMTELFSPIAVYYIFFSGSCTLKRPWRVIYILLLITSLIFASSTASFLIIPASFFIAGVFYAPKVVRFLKRKLLKSVIYTFMSVLFFILLDQIVPFSLFIISSITDKADSTSFYDREERMNFFYQNFSSFNFMHKLIGAGPSAHNILGFEGSKSILSLYYSVIFEVGIMGFLFLICHMLYALYASIALQTRLGFFLTVGLISGCLHYNFIANYWYPWFWFMAAFVVFIKNNQSRLASYTRPSGTPSSND